MLHSQLFQFRQQHAQLVVEGGALEFVQAAGHPARVSITLSAIAIGFPDPALLKMETKRPHRTVSLLRDSEPVAWAANRTRGRGRSRSRQARRPYRRRASVRPKSPSSSVQ